MSNSMGSTGRKPRVRYKPAGQGAGHSRCKPFANARRHWLIRFGSLVPGPIESSLEQDPCGRGICVRIRGLAEPAIVCRPVQDLKGPLSCASRLKDEPSIGSDKGTIAGGRKAGW